jgi:hypothetical protein
MGAIVPMTHLVTLVPLSSAIYTKAKTEWKKTFL